MAPLNEVIHLWSWPMLMKSVAWDWDKRAADSRSPEPTLEVNYLAARQIKWKG